MKATHFGAGNIGRGFIGEILFKNQFSINFVDINEETIDALNTYGEYDIELADVSHEEIHIENVAGINNQTDPDQVVQSIAESDIVTTAIGPNILPLIAELIAKGIRQRRNEENNTPLDIIACENMIGGSQFLFEKVKDFLTDEDLAYVTKYIGFPNAAVDRIVPVQHQTDPLRVSVEPFKEWIIDAKQSKNQELRLNGVLYVDDLEPYIERKLFSVNTGHATVAYTGAYLGYQTIVEAMKDETVLEKLQDVLKETSQLLISKWNFDEETHRQYVEKVISRFQNQYISDDINRVARTPIRKLGYDERFVRPMRELKERKLDYKTLIDVVAMILTYDAPSDEQSVVLQQLIKNKPLETVIYQVTSLKDEELISEIISAYKQLEK